MQKYDSLQEPVPFTRVGSAQEKQGVEGGDEVARHLGTPFIDGGARSSAVEHSVHIGGVTGSNPVAPTIADEQYNPTILYLTSEHQQEGADRGLEIEVGHIYVIEAIGLGRYKIGMAGDVRHRFPSYQTECPVACRPLIIGVVPKADIRKIEKKMHVHYHERRVKGEWFELTQADLEELPSVLKRVVRPWLGMVTRDINKNGWNVSHPANARREQRYELEMMRQQERDSVPTVDLVLDRVEWLLSEERRWPRIDDIVKSIGRRPQRVHEATRYLLLAGKLAVVCPRRSETGNPWFDSYRHYPLTFPDASCNWEETSCGNEILCWEPLGEFVAEYYGRNANWSQTS